MVSGGSEMEESLQDRIRERAYEIWEAGGRMHGEAEQHWFAAEREVQSRMTAEIVPSKPVVASKVTRQRQFVANVQGRAKSAAKAG
jgi:Protein of unknown function (DUF2934)